MSFYHSEAPVSLRQERKPAGKTNLNAGRPEISYIHISASLNASSEAQKELTNSPRRLITLRKPNHMRQSDYRKDGEQSRQLLTIGTVQLRNGSQKERDGQILHQIRMHACSDE